MVGKGQTINIHTILYGPTSEANVSLLEDGRDGMRFNPEINKDGRMWA